MLSVIMLSVIMLSVIMLSVIMVNVVAPSILGQTAQFETVSAKKEVLLNWPIGLAVS